MFEIKRKGVLVQCWISTACFATTLRPIVGFIDCSPIREAALGTQMILPERKLTCVEDFMNGFQRWLGWCWMNRTPGSALSQPREATAGLFGEAAAYSKPSWCGWSQQTDSGVEQRVCRQGSR